MQQKYQIGNEYGSIVWDIELLLKDKANFKTRVYDVDELYQKNPSSINEDYAMTTDVSQPLIVVELLAGVEKLIDGNHRLYKAHMQGISMIECYYLSREEHIPYICEYDSEQYDKVVINWQ